MRKETPNVTQTDESKPRQIIRRLSLAVTVNTIGDIPEAGRHLERFLTRIDHAHDPFDIEMGVSVNPLGGMIFAAGGESPDGEETSGERQQVDINIRVEGGEDDGEEV